MKKVLSLSLGLIFIGNFLFAANGDYISVPAGGNWNATATWTADYGLGFAAATDYPGQNTGTGIVTISLGATVTLNVSPNAIGSLALIIGNGTETLNISGGFTLNVTNGVLIAGAQGGAGVNKILNVNAGSTLNAGSLTITPGSVAARLAVLQINGGTVNVTGDLTMDATADALTTRVNFTGGGTLTVGGSIIGAGQMTVDGVGTATINADPASFGNVIMNNAGATLDMNGNLTVSGTLTLTAGKIDIGPNLLVLSNAAPATQLAGGNTTSYVYTTSGAGRLVRQNLATGNITFPVGTPTFYMPVITNTPAGANSFAVSVYSPAASNATVGGPAFSAAILLRIVNAMWIIDRPVGGGTSTLTLNWLAGAGLEGATFAALGNASIGISRHDGLSWSTAIQTAGDNGANTVTANFTAFGVFGVADIGAALPVKFGAIKAYEKLNGIQLDWKVYSENKVKSYEIERSGDGRSYTTVGSLPALYNNTADGDYGFFDANPLAGISYYRIKNNDMDGKSAYSIVVRVNRNKAIQGLSLYPNPVLNRIVTLQGSDLGRGNYKINIFGANGQEIFKQQITHNGGTISQTIELPPTISKGIYMFTVKDESGNIIFNDKLVNQ